MRGHGVVNLKGTGFFKGMVHRIKPAVTFGQRTAKKPPNGSDYKALGGF